MYRFVFIDSRVIYFSNFLLCTTDGGNTRVLVISFINQKPRRLAFPVPTRRFTPVVLFNDPQTAGGFLPILPGAFIRKINTRDPIVFEDEIPLQVPAVRPLGPQENIARHFSCTAAPKTRARRRVDDCTRGGQH